MLTQAQCSYASLFNYGLVVLCFTAFDRECYDSISKNIFKGWPSDIVSKFMQCWNAQLTYRKIISFPINFIIFFYPPIYFIVNLLQINLTLSHLVIIYVVTCRREFFILVVISLKLLSGSVGEVSQSLSHRRVAVQMDICQ